MLQESKIKSCDTISAKFSKNYIDFVKYNTHKNYCILSLLSQNANRKFSLATTDSNQVNPLSLDYDICDTSKLDESDISLSDISDLDLDAKEESDKKLNDSFNSLDSGEKQKIFKNFKKNPKKQKSINCEEDKEYEDELEKELISIKAEIIKKRRLSVQPIPFFFSNKKI